MVKLEIFKKRLHIREISNIPALKIARAFEGIPKEKKRKR